MKTILRNKQLRTKVLIILGLMLLVRLGSVIPLPGVNTEYMDALVSSPSMAFVNMLTGNSLSSMSLFALSISPYITASIIIQLLTVAIPKLEDLQKDGATGKEKMERITMITGVVLAFIQSLCMAIGLGHNGLFNNYTWWMVVIMTAIWTLGAWILMVIGKFITKQNLGNGISYILLFNILSTFVNDGYTLFATVIYGHKLVFQIIGAVVIIVVAAAIIYATVVLSVAERDIPIQYAARTSQYSKMPVQNFPIPLNTCGVIPIIFTSSLFALPSLIATFTNVGWLSELSKYLSTSYWFNISSIKYTIGAIFYIALTYAFTFFCLDIYFNVQEISMNLKKQGAAIPGIRPGKPTEEYLRKISVKMAMLGTTCMLAIVIVMAAVCNLSGVGTLNIGGTSILICVSVIVETRKIFKVTIQSTENSKYYKFNESKKGERTSFLFGA